MRHLSAFNILVALILLALITYMLALKANAHSIPCGGLFEPTCASVRHYHKRRVYRKKRRHRKPQVRAYQRRERDDGISCKDRLTVIGDARPTRGGAVSDAEGAFMRAARFRHGESWMSVDNAKNYEIRCARASITEVVGTTMMRCELRARPCRPPFESK